jgi:hypothetical protein
MAWSTPSHLYCNYAVTKQKRVLHHQFANFYTAHTSSTSGQVDNTMFTIDMS